MRYNIEMTEDRGGFHAAALAETIGGSVISTTPKFDGTHDLAIIEFPDECEAEMDDLLERDGKVLAYR